MKPSRFQRLLEASSPLPCTDDEVLFGHTAKYAYWQIAIGIKAGDKYWRDYDRDVKSGAIPEFPRPTYTAVYKERGHILIELRHSKWYVTDVRAFERGYGPLLYDIAMEYATMHGSGLNPHAAMGLFNAHTTPEAERIWQYYRTNRPDVRQGDTGFSKDAVILPALQQAGLIIPAPFNQNWLS